MKIIPNYVNVNNNKNIRSISFSGGVTGMANKYIKPEIVTDIMGNNCAKIIAELNIGSRIMTESDKFIKLREEDRKSTRLNSSH